MATHHLIHLFSNSLIYKEDMEMNKWILKVTSFLLVGILLVGCGSGENNENSSNTNQNETNTTESESPGENIEDEDKVTITLSKDEESEFIDELEAPVEEGDILMDVLKETFAVEEEGGFITSIQGVGSDEDEDKAWIFTINGEMAEKGADEIELSPGDEISFDFQAY